MHPNGAPRCDLGEEPRRYFHNSVQTLECFSKERTHLQHESRFKLDVKHIRSQDLKYDQQTKLGLGRRECILFGQEEHE